MSSIKKERLGRLGYDFLTEEFIPAGKDEYYLRNEQQTKSRSYRALTAAEILELKANNNFASNWADVWVTDKFIPAQIHHSKFFGFIRIGDMDSIFLEYRELRLASGIYNSQVISCDLGDFVALHHVRYISHYIVGDEVMLANISEMETSNNAKFGNGILKEGDDEARRIQMELCNENGGRAVLPFDGMQAGDVYLWSRNRQDMHLQAQFKAITDQQFSKKRGFYSTIGNRCVIKNCQTVKDVKIGEHAYIKGVNKLKNLTINSSELAYTQIGEGCELVNGIIGYGCRIFYGVKAVRFILSSFSQLKYGARLINSFLGDNSTISCCEVLNSLLFPAHEQHHNNSFLCASLIKGQSNMAAGATVGSNHNSRAADGEIIAGRGFWPGLCVSLKHNSKFASYTLIVKGDFLHELDIRIPFSLVSNDTVKDQLVLLPGYWFMYNMYALMRNTSKFTARDKRQFKNQYIEYDVLAPDTVNEIFTGLAEIEYAVGYATSAQSEGNTDQAALRGAGKRLLEAPEKWNQQQILLQNVECSKRQVVLAKPKEAHQLFKRMIRYYAALEVLAYLKRESIDALLTFVMQNKELSRVEFENIGGQLVPVAQVEALLTAIKAGTIATWDAVHMQYHQWSARYLEEKFKHALASLAEITSRPLADWDKAFIQVLLIESIKTREWICQEIFNSRSKDYQNPFKLMVYESLEEMEEVIGKLDDNAFINSERQAFARYKNEVEAFLQ